MDTKTTLSISEARKKIFQIAEEVQKPNTHYTLTENGRPKAVLISAEEFESWIETLEVMEEFPDLAKDIKQLDEDIKSGAYKTYPTLEDIMSDYGFVLADKANTSVSRSSRDEKKYGTKFKNLPLGQNLSGFAGKKRSAQPSVVHSKIRQKSKKRAG